MTAGYPLTGPYTAGRPRGTLSCSSRLPVEPELATQKIQEKSEGVVELIGIEPTTSGLQSPRSPS